MSKDNISQPSAHLVEKARQAQESMNKQTLETLKQLPGTSPQVIEDVQKADAMHSTQLSAPHLHSSTSTSYSHQTVTNNGVVVKDQESCNLGGVDASNPQSDHPQ